MIYITLSFQVITVIVAIGAAKGVGDLHFNTTSPKMEREGHMWDAFGKKASGSSGKSGRALTGKSGKASSVKNVHWIWVSDKSSGSKSSKGSSKSSKGSSKSSSSSSSSKSSKSSDFVDIIVELHEDDSNYAGAERSRYLKARTISSRDLVAEDDGWSDDKWDILPDYGGGRSSMDKNGNALSYKIFKSISRGSKNDSHEDGTIDEKTLWWAKKAHAATIAEDMGLTATFTYGSVMFGFSVQNADKTIMAVIESDPRVKSVTISETIYVDPIETHPRSQGYWRKMQQTQMTPWGITRVGAPGDDYSVFDNRRACIFDTGIDRTHPDLNIAEDCFSAFGDLDCQDNDGHGTHVAGIVAAIDNDIDVIGVAPGATVVAIKVLEVGSDGTASGGNHHIIAGIDWARVNANCYVANMSFGGGTNEKEDEAVRNLAASGVLVTIAAGNDGINAMNASPSRVSATNVYTISNLDRNENLASTSNYGNPPIDYAAPGEDIMSLSRGGGTVSFSGTSMAAPHVAGILLYGEGICSDGRINRDRDGTPDLIAHMCPSSSSKSGKSIRKLRRTKSGEHVSKITKDGMHGHENSNTSKEVSMKSIKKIDHELIVDTLVTLVNIE